MFYRLVKFVFFLFLAFNISCSSSNPTTPSPIDNNICEKNSLGGCEQDSSLVDSPDSIQSGDENLNLTICENNKSCSCSKENCALVCEQENICECDAPGCKILCSQNSTCINKAAQGKIDCITGAKSCECQHEGCEVVSHDSCEKGGKCDCAEEQCTVECGIGGICSCSGANCVSVCAPEAQCSCSGEQCAVICPEGSGDCKCSEGAKDCLVIPIKTCQEDKPCSSDKDGALVECAKGGACSCSGNLCTVICHEKSSKCSCSGSKCIVGECIDGESDPRCSCSGSDCFIAPPLGEEQQPAP